MYTVHEATTTQGLWAIIRPYRFSLLVKFYTPLKLGNGIKGLNLLSRVADVSRK